MPLSPGTTLGPYEIMTVLGSGGMGEVYKARDARLDRDVAIKVLPAGVADNPTRRARFTREAQAIAQLSHPHICAIYDVGEERGIAYLVMEYIDGESLEQRLRLGPLPRATALLWAIQIASAIDAAHHRGIVHRDLKPANVMIAESGVKLLDFGLAKLIEGSDDGAGRANQPTASLTSEHRFVGTLRYMAPEQLEGRHVDARTDVFAFGVTLSEMLGDSVAHGILDHIVRRAMARNPDDRWQTARDLMLELQWILDGKSGSASIVRGGVRRRAMAAIGAVLALVAAAALGWYAALVRRMPAAESTIEWTIDAPAGTTLDLGIGVALSPDGRKIAFTAGPDLGSRQIYWRSLDAAALHPILGTEGGNTPFWSPDSASIGFYADGNRHLKRVSLAGGPPSLITNLETRWLGNTNGAFWSADNTIVFGQPGGLFRVAAAGGELTLISAAGSMPAALPGGRWMYSELSRDRSSAIKVAGPGLPTPATLAIRSNVAFAAGHLVFREGTSLVARPFDERAVRFTGPPITLSESVYYNPANGRTAFTASGDVIAYKRDSPARLTWFSRDGRPQGSIGEMGHDWNPSLSPDGSGRVGIDRWDPVSATYHIWTLDQGERAVQITRGKRERFATWSTDGLWIAYWFLDADTMQIRRKRSSGEGAEETLVTSTAVVPLELNEDFLLYNSTASNDLFARPIGGGEPIQITNTPKVSETTAKFSPDGRWVAYTSNEGGRENIWVQEFPSGASKHAVTTTGGGEPQWRQDGREIFYLRAENWLTALPVIGSGMTFGSPAPLFKYDPGGPHLYSYAPYNNGQRFLVNQRVNSPDEFTVVTHWPSRVR